MDKRLHNASKPYQQQTEITKGLGQGCQMVSFKTKNPNLGKVWRALDGKMLIYVGMEL
jgi:hypothetical protein